jgi:hypothetical protein
MGGSPAPRFGRYELVERIAIGGMAELYRARLDGAHNFHKPVVIKKILPHLSADPNFVSMFIDEAKITAQLNHPKIVQVFELGTTDNELFIAMEYVEGIDLLKLLRYHARRSRRITEHIAVHIAHEVLDALDHAHQAIDDEGRPLAVVHRDVSPGNVLISSRGAVKLTDFGIARAAARNQKTEAGTLKGKYGYMSPEQVINADVDGRSDLFAVGVVFAEMLMGKRLFVAPSDLDVLIMVRDVDLERLERYGQHIDPELVDLIHRALEPEPEERIQTAAAFRDELADWLFERRHRVAAKHIAQLVAEVRAGGAVGLDQGAVGTPVAQVARRDGDETPITEVEGRGRLRASTEVPLPEVNIQWRRPEPEPQVIAENVIEIELDAPLGTGPLPELGSETSIDPLGDVGSQHPLLDPGSIDEQYPLLDPGSVNFSEAVSQPGLSGFTEIGAVSLEDPGSISLGDPGSIPLELDDTPFRPKELDESDESDQSDEPDEITVEVEGAAGARSARRAMTQPERPSRRKRRSSSPLAEAVSDAAERAASEQAAAQALVELDSAEFEFAEPRPENRPERGELGHLTALALFASLVKSRATGRLALVLEPTHKEIYFIGGEPKYVSSNVARERLGEFLLYQGKISSGELSMALSMLPQFDNRLIAALVGLGLMNDSEAIHSLTQQVRAKLVDACGWEKGSYRFYPGEDIPYPWLPLPLDPYEVMGASALGTTEEFIDGWSQWREDRIPRIVRPQPIPVDYFRVAEELRDVMVSLDGKKTIAELRESFTNPRAWRRFCRLLFLLTEVGSVRVIQS